MNPVPSRICKNTMPPEDRLLYIHPPMLRVSPTCLYSSEMTAASSVATSAAGAETAAMLACGWATAESMDAAFAEAGLPFADVEAEVDVDVAPAAGLAAGAAAASLLVRFTACADDACTRSAGVIKISSPHVPVPTARTGSALRA